MSRRKRTKDESATYWEGWQAYRTRQMCPLTDPAERAQWAAGFAAAVEDDRGPKVWYKSKTFVVGISLLAFGLVMFFWGSRWEGFGGGVSALSLLMIWLRTVTDSPVSLYSQGGA